MSLSRRPGNARAYHAGVMAVGREPRGPVSKYRARCAALPRTVPRTEPQHAKLSTCATCHAAHRADGAAARWGHRALPPRDTSVEHGHGTRAVGRSEGAATGGGNREAFCRFSRFRFEKTAVFKKKGLRYNQIVASALGSIHFHSWLYKIYVPIRSGSIKFCSDWGLSPLLLLL